MQKQQGYFDDVCYKQRNHPQMMKNYSSNLFWHDYSISMIKHANLFLVAHILQTIRKL